MYGHVMHDQNWNKALPRTLATECLRIVIAFLAMKAYVACMNSKQRRTLESVFADPVSGTVPWNDIEGLLIASGARLIEGRGSRVRFACGDEVESFHRPHPAKEAKRYQVRAAREFLERIGVTP
jgi:HicA toxin of bacterial toxin-antitoxin,